MNDANPLGLEAPAPRGDNQDPAHFGQTPWQTVGPFFHYGLPWRGGADLAGGPDGDRAWGARPDLFDEAHWVLHLAPPRGPISGEVIEVSGRVLDARGDGVPDAMIEIWQADAAGRYACHTDPGSAPRPDDGFTGFGRAAVDVQGGFHFRTVKPGAVPGPGGTPQAPHLAVGLFGRGLLKRLASRIYFADSSGLDDDPVLALVPAERRRTLIAVRVERGYRLDFRLSGPGETVFFEF